MHLQQRLLPLLLILIVAMALPGCSSTFQTALQMRPDTRAQIVVYGENPFVTIDNAGPGAVEVIFTNTAFFESDRMIVPPRTASGQTLRDGSSIEIRTAFDEPSEVRIDIQNASGVEMQQIPEPAGTREETGESGE